MERERGGGGQAGGRGGGGGFARCPNRWPPSRRRRRRRTHSKWCRPRSRRCRNCRNRSDSGRKNHSRPHRCLWRRRLYRRTPPTLCEGWAGGEWTEAQRGTAGGRGPCWPGAGRGRWVGARARSCGASGGGGAGRPRRRRPSGARACARRGPASRHGAAEWKARGWDGKRAGRDGRTAAATRGDESARRWEHGLRRAGRGQVVGAKRVARQEEGRYSSGCVAG